LFNGILGLKPAMIPFNSAAAVMNALVAGHVDYMSAPIAEVVPQVQGGTIKVFAIASPERSPALPEVPTSREAGLPEFQVLSWNGLFAPKDTPSLVLDKLADALDQSLDDETTRKRLFELGSDVPAKARRGRDQLAALVRSEMARWASIHRAATQ
jgi:tripartite-type tricarboxylate transporter receptor subunit TctC